MKDFLLIISIKNLELIDYLSYCKSSFIKKYYNAIISFNSCNNISTYL